MEVGESIGDKQKPPRSSHIATIMCSLLFAGAKNPAIGCAQTLLDVLDTEKCSDELREKVMKEASGQVESFERKNQNGLIHLCLKETLRLSSHSIGGIRKVMKSSGYRLGSYWVPPNTYIACSHISPHLDPVWGSDYAEWNPERDLLPTADDYTYTAFSHGVHRCPGRDFAYVLMEAILAVLFDQYELKAVQLYPYNFERATLAQRDGPCSISYKKRSSR